MQERFRPGAGCFFQALEQTCAGDPITENDVSRIVYTVYELGYNGSRTAVTGHNTVSVPTSCVTEVQTDPETQEQYNVRIPISAITNRPFPNVGCTYEIEVIFYDQNGEPHAEYKQGLCDTT